MGQRGTHDYSTLASKILTLRFWGMILAATAGLLVVLFGLVFFGDKGCSSRGESAAVTAPTPVATETVAKSQQQPEAPKLLIESGWDAASTMLRAGDYLVLVGADGDSLRAEKGDELVVLRYARARDAAPPKCVSIWAKKGQLADWRAVLGSYTGVSGASVPKNPPYHAPGAPITVNGNTIRLQLSGDPQVGVVGVVLDRGGCE